MLTLGLNTDPIEMDTIVMPLIHRQSKTTCELIVLVGKV